MELTRFYSANKKPPTISGVYLRRLDIDRGIERDRYAYYDAVKRVWYAYTQNVNDAKKNFLNSTVSGYNEGDLGQWRGVTKQLHPL